MDYIFITGGAGGLGNAVAKDLANSGFKVFVGDINQAALDKINNPNMIPVHINISDIDSVNAAVELVKTYTNKLYAVINVAGILSMGSMIETPPATMRRILDINVMGMYLVNQGFFPLILEGKGRIINFSSEMGYLSAAPFNGLYGVSKHAVETYNDTLRRELAFVNIPVIKIQPGSFKTEMHNDAEANFTRLYDNTQYFKIPLGKLKPIMINELKHANDPKYLVNAVHKAVVAKRPKAKYRVKNSVKLRFMQMFPECLIDKIYKIFG